jgi:cellulose synthase/poly-beta-1,6-N-acetylglucosamine synthase-like glycosyltransferase
MKVKVAVTIPFGRRVVPEWATQFANLSYPTNCRYAHLWAKNMKRDLARNTLVQQALDLDAEYVLFLDDDTAPPLMTPSALVSVLDQADENVVVCGGIYSTKTDPATPIVYKEPLSGPFWRWKYGEVFPCFAVGTGCMMIRASVFKALPQPWFRDIDNRDEADAMILSATQDDGNGKFRVTDDLYFCHMLAEHGYKVMAHGGILPMHFDDGGTPHVLARDSYPLKDITTPMWYDPYVVPFGK